jgi:hypothetical protein
LITSSNFDDRALDERCIARGISRTFCAPHVGQIGAFLLNSNLVGSFANSREFLYHV